MITVIILILVFIFISSIITNYILYNELNNLRTLKEIEKNSYAEWLSSEADKKRIISRLCDKRWDEINILNEKYNRALEYIKNRLWK